jgi:hypothetical protein
VQYDNVPNYRQPPQNDEIVGGFLPSPQYQPPINEGMEAGDNFELESKSSEVEEGSDEEEQPHANDEVE